MQALRVRADDYAPGDTDLSWTRVTPWRSVLAGAFDAGLAKVTAVKITSPDTDPCATLLQRRSGKVSSMRTYADLAPLYAG